MGTREQNSLPTTTSSVLLDKPAVMELSLCNVLSKLSQSMWNRFAAVSLGASAKLRKGSGGFVVSVRPRETTRLPLGGFS